jgi:hypothetical protein
MHELLGVHISVEKYQDLGFINRNEPWNLDGVSNWSSAPLNLVFSPVVNFASRATTAD